MCSRGEAVFELEEVMEEAAAVTVADVVDAVTVFVAPGLRDDSIFNTDEAAGATGGSGRGGGGGGDPGGVAPTAVSPAQGWYLGGFLSGCGAVGILGCAKTSASSWVCRRARFSSTLSSSPAFEGRFIF